MKNLLNPKWLFIINTLPIVLLFFLLYGQFSIIKTLLNEDSLYLWKSFGLALGILGILNFSYASYLTLKKQKVSVFYGILALLSYIPFIYLYGHYLYEIFPFSIPQWMISGDSYIYAGTFLMPTLAYSVFILVAHYTPENKEHHAWANFLMAIGIPVAGYLFTQLILPFWQPISSEFGNHAMMILLIAGTLVFLFFLIRSVFILAGKKAIIWQKYQLAWKIPITIILPVIGLMVNNGLTFDRFDENYYGIFGNFNNPWFYILAVLNGILICLPNLDNKIYRLILFFGRSITFSFTFYFFLVFLPFLPLSVIAVVAIGTGFLMLTPLLLFVLHIMELSKDFQYLKKLFSGKAIIGFSLLSFWVIPSFVTGTYLKDKSVLNETLTYLYSPDYSKRYEIDKTSLQKTLDVVKQHKEKNSDILFGSQIPYLSSYFTWLVLDNLTLSDTKINYIEKIFFGEASIKVLPENIRNDEVEITNISTSSTYDKSQNAWKSWIDLEITNKSDWTSEFATTINLPEGCWISDYYLFVEGEKEFGILAEKKSAMWVYSNIRNERKDPGILYYLTGNKVAFRVFPFSGNEVRKTGIEFLHKEPVSLNIDNHIVELGNKEETTHEKIETENFAYVSTQQKQSLNAVQRKPYFHFLVDTSKDKDRYADDFTARIDKVLSHNKSLSENAKISFVNSYVNDFSLLNDWKQNLKTQIYEGGFYLERAINKTLVNAYKTQTYPVIVVVTDRIQNAVLNKDFSDFQFAFPESNYFYNLDEYGYLRPHSLIDYPKSEREVKFKCQFCETVLEYKLPDNSIAYLPDNNEPSIVLKKDIFKIPETEIKEKDWNSALSIQANWISQILHPETADKEWLVMVKNSFASRVMNPVTSYLVVENEAQKVALKKKQQQILAGNKSLDPDEDTARMSEPSWWILVILFGLIIWLKRKRKRLVLF